MRAVGSFVLFRVNRRYSLLGGSDITYGRMLLVCEKINSLGLVTVNKEEATSFSYVFSDEVTRPAVRKKGRRSITSLLVLLPARKNHHHFTQSFVHVGHERHFYPQHK